MVEAAAPRGEFCLIRRQQSNCAAYRAGIGATPVLAMMHALAAAHSSRQIWWLHTTRNAESHAFAAEVTALIESLPNAQQHVFYTGGDGADSLIVRGRLDPGLDRRTRPTRRCDGVPMRPELIHGRYARSPD